MPVPRTVQVTANNGATVRTAYGKRYYVVLGSTQYSRYDRATGMTIAHEPKAVAKVITRTDSAVSAFRNMNRWTNARVNEVKWDGENVTVTDVTHFMSVRAEREKAAKKRQARGY